MLLKSPVLWWLGMEWLRMHEMRFAKARWKLRDAFRKTPVDRVRVPFVKADATDGVKM